MERPEDYTPEDEADQASREELARALSRPVDAKLHSQFVIRLDPVPTNEVVVWKVDVDGRVYHYAWLQDALKTVERASSRAMGSPAHVLTHASVITGTLSWVRMPAYRDMGSAVPALIELSPVVVR